MLSQRQRAAGSAPTETWIYGTVWIYGIPEGWIPRIHFKMQSLDSQPWLDASPAGPGYGTVWPCCSQSPSIHRYQLEQTWGYGLLGWTLAALQLSNPTMCDLGQEICPHAHMCFSMTWRNAGQSTGQAEPLLCCRAQKYQLTTHPVQIKTQAPDEI